MTTMQSVKSKQQGVSLIEVLVAAVIIAIGLLGLAGLQTRSLQMNQSAHYRSQANVYAYKIIDAMRMDRNSARDGDYDFDFGDQTPTGSTIPAQTLSRWIQGIKEALPMGDYSAGNTGGSIEVIDNADTTEVVVKVAWFDERWDEDATTQEKIRNVTLETEL